MSVPSSTAQRPFPMPPLMNRYGPQGLVGSLQHLQQPQMQQQHPQAQHHPSQHNTGLPPPNSASNPGFGQNTNLNASPFSTTGSMTSSAFDRTPAEIGGIGLGSHAAQISFARGGPVQQQHSRNYEGQPSREPRHSTRIRNVWKNNLAHEMNALRQLVDEYPYIAMVSSSLFGDWGHILSSGCPRIQSFLVSLHDP